jgi:hypothetical protein
MVYAITAPVLRVTVALFLQRLVRRRTQRIIIFTTSAIGIVYGGCYLAGVVYQCIPLSFFWERVDHPTGGICFNPNVSVRLTIISTVVAAVMDWTFALLPIWMMWSLHISKQKKIMVCFLLGLGALYVPT